MNGKSPKKIDTLIFIANQFYCSIYEIINQDYIEAIKEELKNVQTVDIKTKKLNKTYSIKSLEKLIPRVGEKQFLPLINENFLNIDSYYIISLLLYFNLDFNEELGEFVKSKE